MIMFAFAACWKVTRLTSRSFGHSIFPRFRSFSTPNVPPHFRGILLDVRSTFWGIDECSIDPQELGGQCEAYRGNQMVPLNEMHREIRGRGDDQYISRNPQRQADGWHTDSLHG